MLKDFLKKITKKQNKEDMNIHQSYSKHVTTQSYKGVSKIDGVEMVNLPWHSDDGGNFTEIFRLSGKNVEGLTEPFEAKQVSMSLLVPGTIKAYHLHFKQDDLWYVPPFQRLLVNLHDVREDSASFDQHQKLLLGGGKNILLRIPRGVAHGIANIYQNDMMMFYATSEQFDPSDPDEHRLPWDLFGTEVWELNKG